MTKSDIKQLVALCDYPELQKLWKPKMGDSYGCWQTCKCHKGEWIGWRYEATEPIKEFSKRQKDYIWLPRIEDAIRLMGDKFITLSRRGDGSYYWCGYYKKAWDTQMYSEQDKSDRVACLKALKAMLKGG